MINSAGGYYGEDSPVDEADTLVIYDPQTKRFDKRHWSECFGEANIYERHFDNFKPSTFAREQWRPFETVQRLDREIFSALIDPVWKIYQNYQSGMIPMRRGDINTMRKFLFLTTSIKNRDRNQHLLAKDPSMEDARIRRKKFMEAHALDHPRDLWLQNAELILDNSHFNIATDPDIFDLDREDYRANARERFMVFWEAGPGEEFVLTENAFGCFEGGGLGARKKLTIEMTAREHEVRMYTKDYQWHQLYVLSPKLVLALCHGTLAHPALTKAQRRRWGLRRSLLEDLPHPLANNYYKDLAKGEIAFLKQGWEVPPEVEKLFGQPRWDGKVIAIENREQDDLVFPVSMLSSEQVSLVNCILLQNQSSAASPVQSVSFRPPSSYRSLHESLVKFTQIGWPKYTDEKQNTYDALEKRLSQYLSKIEDVRSNASTPSVRPSPGIFTPPLMTPDPSSDGRGASKRVEKPCKPETVVTVSSEIKRERRKSIVPEFCRFEQGLPTPPHTQPQSRESSVPPIPTPPAIPNLRTPASSMPPPPTQNSRAPSSERPTLSVVTERPTPHRARAPSSDRVQTSGSTAATTCEMPTRRATVSSQARPPNSQQQQEERRGASRERSYSNHDGIRVQPSPPPPMPELKREQPSRNPSTQPPEQRQPTHVHAAPPPPPQRPTTQRRFSMAHQQAPPPPPPPPAQDFRRPASVERRYSEAAQSRPDSLPRPQVTEKRQPTPGTEVPHSQTQAAAVPVPEPKVQEKRNVSTEQKPESRQPSQSPSTRSPSQTPPQNTQVTEGRTENPKLSPDLLEHIERQRRIEKQRAEQERVKAEQERIAKERAEQERISRERAEKERQERQQRAEQERLNREREQERLNQERARKRAELERQEQERVKAEQLKAEQERQRIEQQRVEEQRRTDKLRLEQEHKRRVEQERRNLEQVRLEQQQIHAQQQRSALENQRKDPYNRSRERSTSAHSTNTLAEAIRADKVRFEEFECHTPSEVSVESNGSGSSGSSGSDGSGSMPITEDSERTERPVKIRGGSASPRRHIITHGRDNTFAKFLQVPYDAATVCDVAESMIVEPDDDEEVWVDEGYAEAPHRELQLFPKPRKPIVRFASPKPAKMFSPQSPTGGRKATIMTSNKVRYAGHVQHAQGGALHAQHPMHNVYPSHREY